MTQKRLRIALFTTSFPANGQSTVNAGVCARDFAEALTAFGHEVWVLTPRKPDSRHEFVHARTIYFPWLGEADSLTHISYKSPIGMLRLGSIVAMGRHAGVRLIEEFEPDHVLCFWVFPSGYWVRGAGRRPDVPYSVWALGSDIWSLPKIPGMSGVIRRLARDAAHCYADGVGLAKDFEAIAHRAVEFLPTSRVLEQPEGIAPGEGGYYLYLGRYHHNKGIDLLLEAVARARHELPGDFRLRAHGFGPLEEAAREQVRSLGLGDIVEILEPTSTEDVPLVLRRARGVIVPSRIESVALVLGDALQMDLPVLVTDVGDMGALVREHDAGAVCPPSVAELARALPEFVRNPPGSRAGRARLGAILDIRESAKRFLTAIGGSTADA